MEIVAVNRAQRLALTDGDDVCEITNFLDEDGDETTEIENAVSAVARLNDNTWFAIDLNAFKPTGAH